MKKEIDPEKHPIIVILPSTIDSKMRAIENLSKAIMDLSHAINSVNVDVKITGCIVNNSSGHGISIQHDTGGTK